MRAYKRELSSLIDVFFAVAAYVVLVRWHVPRAPEGLAQWYLTQAGIIVGTWTLLSIALRRDQVYRLSGMRGEFGETLAVNLLGGLILVAADLLTHHGDVSRVVVVGFPLLSAALSLGARLPIRMGLAAWRRQGHDIRHVLLVGPAGASLNLARWLFRPETGLRPVGMLLPPDSVPPAGTPLRCLGDYRHLPEVLHDRVVDELAVTLPLDDPGLRPVVETAAREGKAVWLQLDSFGSRLLGQDPGRLLLLAGGPDVAWRWAKRGFDVACAGLGVVVAAPLLGLIALAIRLDDPRGPVIFRQRRVGLHGRVFTCFKFRSMVADAEARRRELLSRNEMNGPVFKVRDDPRITRVGRLLRKYSLDELPQLFNVLIGDMSIVGPRPPLPDEVRQYEPHFRRRLSVRPGLTCLWQVSGRNHIDFESWMQLDLDYVDNWSFWLDVMILLRTVPAVLFGSGM